MPRQKSRKEPLLPHMELADLDWRARECRFDRPVPEVLTFKAGEVAIDTLNDVEDTKGNNGQSGRLIVTNLRLIWHSHKHVRTNLSIGFNAMSKLTIKPTSSVLRGGSIRALHVNATNVRYGRNTKYHFIFTNVVEGSPRLFTSIQAVQKAFESSRIYRELRVRTAITTHGTLNLLPNELLIHSIDGVMNINGDSGTIGTLTWTSHRITWVAQMNLLHNISMPYLTIAKMYVKDTKFGRLIIVQTKRSAFQYTLGYRIDPPDKASDYFSEIVCAFESFCKKPDFGLRYEQSAPIHPLAAAAPIVEDDDVEIVGDGDAGDAFGAYFADDDDVTSEHRPPVYSEELGLAIETLRPGATLKKLWSVS
mmetsp:Transcript_22567/g.58927  ORF Transcript_22567/g.58927 Transcript_22567/m.58927 type:complete len:364 (-) Transcript_22567:52-1143(-)